MAILLKHPELEDRLAEQCVHSPVATVKTHLSAAIIQAVLDAAEATGTSVFEVMRGLPKPNREASHHTTRARAAS